MNNKVTLDEIPDSKPLKVLLWGIGIAFTVAMILSALQIAGTIDINYGVQSYNQWLIEHNQSYQEYLANQEHQNVVAQVAIMVMLPPLYALYYWFICGYYPTQWTKCSHGHVISKNKLNNYCRTCGVKLHTEEPLV